MRSIHTGRAGRIDTRARRTEGVLLNAHVQQVLEVHTDLCATEVWLMASGTKARRLCVSMRVRARAVCVLRATRRIACSSTGWDAVLRVGHHLDVCRVSGRLCGYDQAAVPVLEILHRFSERLAGSAVDEARGHQAGTSSSSEHRAVRR